MKYLKHFEDTIEDKPTQPKVGDYVICEEITSAQPDLVFFIANTIGKIVNIKNTYLIHYDNIPEDLRIYFRYDNKDNNNRVMMSQEIIHCSPDKEELETILKVKKYNI